MGRLEAYFWMNSLFGIIAGLLAGTAAAMGLGGGSVLLIYLTVFAGVNQITAQGINLIFFLPTAAFAVFIYAKRGVIRWKIILPIMLFGALATIFSSWAVSFISPDIIRKIFGGLIIIYGLLELFKKKSNE